MTEEQTPITEEEEAAPEQPTDDTATDSAIQRIRELGGTVRFGDVEPTDGVFEFVAQLGPGSLEAYRSNAAYREMVDSKITSLVSARSDELPVPSSEEVGGSSEKETRSGLRGQREAFERSGLGEHMSFDEFIADVEV